MSPLEADRKEALAQRTLDTLATRHESRGGSAHLFWVPGRIEFLGKHTDYAGGRSLVCAAERGFCIAAAPRTDDVLRMHDATSGETMEVPMAGTVPTRPGHWSNYPLTVVRRVQRKLYVIGRRTSDIA